MRNQPPREPVRIGRISHDCGRKTVGKLYRKPALENFDPAEGRGPEPDNQTQRVVPQYPVGKYLMIVNVSDRFKSLASSLFRDEQPALYRGQAVRHCG